MDNVPTDVIILIMKILSSSSSSRLARTCKKLLNIWKSNLKSIISMRSAIPSEFHFRSIVYVPNFILQQKHIQSGLLHYFANSKQGRRILKKKTIENMDIQDSYESKSATSYLGGIIGVILLKRRGALIGLNSWQRLIVHNFCQVIDATCDTIARYTITDDVPMRGSCEICFEYRKFKRGDMEYSCSSSVLIKLLKLLSEMQQK